MTTSTPGASGPALRSGRSTLALSYPDFRILWVTTGLVAGGVWFQQVTLGWLAYDLTRSPLHVAGVVGVRTLPLLLAPITGVIADRFDRRKLLLIDQALVTILVFGFAALLLLNLQQVWHLYVFALLFGLLWAGNNPVRQVLVANTVPREALMNATALISLSFNLMRTLGPAVGGLVIAYMGPGINFLIQGVFFLFAGLLLIRMRTPYSAPDKMHAREDSPLRNLMDGFRHVKSDPTTLITIGMSLGMSFTMLSIVFSQMPVYAAEVLGNDDGTYLGLLLTGDGDRRVVRNDRHGVLIAQAEEGAVVDRRVRAVRRYDHRAFTDVGALGGHRYPDASADVHAGGDDDEHDHHPHRHAR